ncbi:metallophosphoesterase family protein [Effusibacillus lacus]|uniref:Phosphodiesterase n=1 Tax=Effusibacillus lacus TaxID=1348429 RepID=A0A292YJC2_9BACL|nr:metallophosphoesterase family protein [Effusibacillus lacus]TCS74613.1 putative phosphoesterase [Effusibacillus lacus]GAX88484.1 phosphodiesterase [Effusibacillus lacus]
MRVAFLSDIHGNAVALEAVLADIQSKNVDRIVVLGDIAYRGPEPKRSVEMVKNLNTEVIKGNADEWTVRGVREGEVPAPMLEMMNREREWAVQRLDQSDLDYLKELPAELTFNLTDAVRVHAFHATPESLFEVVMPDQPANLLQDKLMKQENSSLYVYAHIHLPYVRYLNGKCLVNIGSVGLPFDGMPKASYALVEAAEDRYSVTIERVPYDLERVVSQYNDGNYPNLETMARVIRQAVSPFTHASESPVSDASFLRGGKGPKY